MTFSQTQPVSSDLFHSFQLMWLFSPPYMMWLGIDYIIIIGIRDFPTLSLSLYMFRGTKVRNRLRAKSGNDLSPESRTIIQHITLTRVNHTSKHTLFDSFEIGCLLAEKSSMFKAEMSAPKESAFSLKHHLLQAEQWSVYVCMGATLQLMWLWSMRQLPLMWLCPAIGTQASQIAYIHRPETVEREITDEYMTKGALSSSYDVQAILHQRQQLCQWTCYLWRSWRQVGRDSC